MGGKLETLAKQTSIYTVQLSKQTINKIMVLSASGVIEIKAHQQSKEKISPFSPSRQRQI